MESSKTMKQVSPEGLRWFQDARFVMFIHWGLYSLLAREEAGSRANADAADKGKMTKNS